VSGPLGRFLSFRRSRRAIRRAGDRARDARRWNEAVTNYAAYLRYNPKDVPIRVQLGNCLKEAGQLTEALDAYKTAIELDGAHADGHLQIGHLFKILGRNEEAAQAYRKSFELSPHENPAFAELLAIGAVPQVRGSDYVGSQEAAIIYMDVTDLIDYLRVNVALSGIQRVVSNLISNIPRPAGTTGLLVRPVLPDYSGSQIFLVNVSLLEGLISLVTSGRSDRQLIDRALDSLRASQSLVMPKAGDTLLVPGAFWIYQRYDLLNILRQSGVRVAVFIHDLIQVTNPEFVEPAATTVFRRSLVDVLCTASYVLTNSKFVAEDVRRYLAGRLNFQIPVIPITLATELKYKKSDGVNFFMNIKILRRKIMCFAWVQSRSERITCILLKFGSG
jgi:tetratricopeptide (TPR) repeat protein